MDAELKEDIENFVRATLALTAEMSPRMREYVKIFVDYQEEPEKALRVAMGWLAAGCDDILQQLRDIRVRMNEIEEHHKKGDT